MVSRLSLRARLVLAVIVLATVGLAAANVATYASLRSFLLERTDEALAELARSAERDLERDCSGRRGPGHSPPGSSPGDFFQLRGGDGRVLCTRQVSGASGGETPSPPALPETVEARSFTVPAQEGGGRYRVSVSTDRDGEWQLLVATPLSDVDATLRRLLLIMLLVTAAVLVSLALLGLQAVRIGLRPLDAIEATAAAIARGDLSRRVDRAEPHTEVGRLGLALNAMLGQIESAFRAKDASERKLRRFVADASHELRTPLAAVRAYAELFGRGADRRPDDLARSMAGITRESERMSVLVDDNLLGNARVHTPPGAPVQVRLARENGSALIEVADSGPGLRAADVERVFERFYRSDESRSRESGGVGLGLSIVTAVARAHGGSAAAASRPGAGATFRIVLPLAHS